jgi:hypothetical protein
MSRSDGEVYHFYERDRIAHLAYMPWLSLAWEQES